MIVHIDTEQHGSVYRGGGFSIIIIANVYVAFTTYQAGSQHLISPSDDLTRWMLLLSPFYRQLNLRDVK